MALVITVIYSNSYKPGHFFQMKIFLKIWYLSELEDNILLLFYGNKLCSKLVYLTRHVLKWILNTHCWGSYNSPLCMLILLLWVSLISFPLFNSHLKYFEERTINGAKFIFLNSLPLNVPSSFLSSDWITALECGN